MKTRKRWADIAKFFAIVAVVLGHTDGVPDALMRFIFTFHMPLFFVMSGYFMKDTDDIRKSVKKDAVGLLLPYGVTCLMMMVLQIIKTLMWTGVSGVPGAIKTWVSATLYGAGGVSLIPDFLKGVRGVGAIWFLLALFFAKLLIYLTQNLGKYQWIALLAIAYLGYKTADYIWLPLSIQGGMGAVFYVYLGKVIAKNNLFEKTYKSKNAFLYIGAAAVWLFCIKYCGSLYMVSNTYKNGLLDVIGSFCAIFVVVWISMLIENYIPIISKPLAFMGEISLVILCAHITELNIFPWDKFFEFIHIERTWEIAFLLKLIIIPIMCVVLYIIPIINKVYFSQKRKKRTK